MVAMASLFLFVWQLGLVDAFSVPSVPWHSVRSSSTVLAISSRTLRLLATKTPSSPPLSTTSSLEEDCDDADYRRRDRIHQAIEKLRFQIPSLLSAPLTEASSKAVYDDNVKLKVAASRSPTVTSSTNDKTIGSSNKGIVLASSREELVSLSNTLVLAMRATSQANSFFSTASSWGRPPTDRSTRKQGDYQEQQSTNLTPVITGDMVIDPALEAIRVRWQVQLPRGAQGQKQKLQGVSDLILDETSGKVIEHGLRQVQWNDEELNALAIGESLANLRQLVVSLQESPVLQSFLPKSMLSPTSLTSLLGPDFMQQLTPSTAELKELQRPSLFVVESLESAFVASNNTTSSRANATAGPKQERPKMTPIDGYNTLLASSRPLPGSDQWYQYSTSRKVVRTFVDETLPALAGTKLVSSKEMLELFSTHATLVAPDGSELLQGRDQVGNFFHTVSSWRKRSSGNWTMIQSKALNWRGDITIAIDFRETSPLPGSSTPVVIEGTDEFTLVNPSTWRDDTDGMDESSETKGDREYDDPPDIVIQRVKQRKLVIGDGSSSNSLEGVWFMKGLISALDTGRFSSVGGDSVVMDLLQRAIAGDMGAAGSDSPTAKRPRRQSPPKLSQAAAARVYNIMAGLHQDLSPYFEQEFLREYQLPPGHEFMTETIELRGYLGETLIRGSKSYNSVVGATLASLKRTIASGNVELAEDPSIAVALTATGNVRLSFALDLRILPLLSGAANVAATNLLSSMGMSLSVPSTGFPLKIEFVSEYSIDKQSGDIYLHQLVETRVNGQLTPGDVVSKWVLRQVGRGDRSLDKSGDALLRSLLDTVSWVRSMGRS